MQAQLLKISCYTFVLFFTSILFDRGSETNAKRASEGLGVSIFRAKTGGARFEDVFIEKQRIILKETKQYAAGAFGDIEVSMTGKIYLADPQNHCVPVFSSQGEFLKQIGRQGKGPGEFTLPMRLELYNGTVIVVDTGTHRVSQFTETGEFLDSFVTSAENYMPLEIKVNSKGPIYINGPIFDLAMQKTGAHQLHKYNAKFEYEKSFYPFNSKIAEFNLWSEIGITLDIDNRDNLFIAEPVEYKISKYTESGELIGSFTRNAKFYKPPSKLLDIPSEKTEAALRKWLPTWTHLVRLVCHKGFVLVQFRVHQPKQYLIELFDYAGNYITGEILTDYRLACRGKDGWLYFVTSEPSETADEYSIGQFTIKLKSARE